MTTTLAPSTRGSRAKCKQCGLKGKHMPECPNAGCEYCGAQVGHQPECPEYTDERTKPQCDVAIEEHRCQKHAGHDGPHENTEDGGTMVWGYPDAFEEQSAQDESSGAIKTEVDGKEANIVLDGTSGAPAQPELIQTPIEERIRAIGRKEEELDEARREKKRASDHVKALEEEHELMVRALVAQVDGVQTLPMDLDSVKASKAAEPADEDGEQPEDAPLTGREMRALRMTDEPQEDHFEKPLETQPLSTRAPGLYVADNEGPED